MGKFESYTAITNVQNDDILLVDDIHDTSMSASGTTKKMTISQLPFNEPVVSLGSTSSQQGQWQAVATISLTSQYFSADTSLYIQGSGGPDQASSASVKFYVKQDAAMGSPPTITLTANDCQTIAPGNFWAIITSNTSGLTTVVLYLQAPANYESYAIRELASEVAGATLTYASGGSTWLSSLPSGTQQYAIFGPTKWNQPHETGPLEAWESVLAGRHYAACSIMCIGTSITAGSFLSQWEQSWPVMLQNALNIKFPSNGLNTHGRGVLPPILHDTSIGTDYITVTGTPGVQYGAGFNGATYDISAGGGCTLTYHLVGTTAYILYTSDISGGSFTWKVDGGGTTTISTSAGSVAGGNIVGPITLGSTPGTAHTLTIQWLSGGTTWVDGVVEYNGDETSGIQVYNCGSSGATTPGWQGSDLHSIATTYAQLYIIELGVNDWGVITPAQFQTDLSALLGVITAACAAESAPTPTFLIMPCYLQYYSTTNQWQEYVSAMYAVALANNAAIMDLSLLMPPGQSGGGPYGLYYADGQHPSEVGHSRIADLLCNYLSPIGV